MSKLGVMSAEAGGRPVVPTGTLLIAGALSSQAGCHSDAYAGAPHIAPVCLDASDNLALAEVCRELNVRYVAGADEADFTLPELHMAAMVTMPRKMEPILVEQPIMA